MKFRQLTTDTTNFPTANPQKPKTSSEGKSICMKYQISKSPWNSIPTHWSSTKAKSRRTRNWVESTANNPGWRRSWTSKSELQNTPNLNLRGSNRNFSRIRLILQKNHCSPCTLKAHQKTRWAASKKSWISRSTNPTSAPLLPTTTPKKYSSG